VEQKRLEKEVWRKEEKEEMQRREEEHQRDLAHHLEVDHIARIGPKPSCPFQTLLPIRR